MPIYEYICKSCGHHMETIQKVSDAPLEKCAQCGGEVYKPISHTSFQLKGGGWYADGYGNQTPKTEKKSESPSEKKTETPSSNTSSDTSKKTESKPAATSTKSD